MSTIKFPFNTPFNTAPFSKIKDSDYLPSITTAIKKAKLEIEAIIASKEEPTFKNTVEALEFSGEELDRLSSLFFNLNSAETSDVLQELAQEISPLLSDFSNDILLNEELFRRIKHVYDNHRCNLNPEEKRLLETKYKQFVRNGANLDDEGKNRLREIDKELGKLKLKFGEHVLAETNAFELHITDENDLSGLPEGAKEAAKQLAKSKGQDGWIFTLNFPSYIPFMTYADNRELRKTMSIAYGSKGFQSNEYDNQDIVLKIVNLRHERAQLLGYDSHAAFVLEERMAKSPTAVLNFLEDLLEKARPAADKEFDKLKVFAYELDGIEELEKWDASYYTEKLKQQLYDLDDEKLKPYFKLEQVIDGVFLVAEKLFDLKFKEIDNIEKYHPDVLTYKVLDSEDKFIAILYADFFPRPGKRNGAWMTSYKPQFIREGENSRPHVSIVCNFTKSTETRPSLLTFNEVKTLFHEFGHALHGMLANTTFPSLSGTGVYWDFVELPSQLMENWCYEEEALSLFARHYETGEPMPSNMLEKIKASSTFMEGMQTVRQISFGLLDMGWHAKDPSAIKDVKTHELKAFSGTQFYPDCKENCMSTSFSHIFQGGYASGYYSYKWAEVLDADAFECFKEHGIFNTTIAGRFRKHILSKGGTQDPMELYVKFRGDKPRPEALLKRAGLLV